MIYNTIQIHTYLKTRGTYPTYMIYQLSSSWFIYWGGFIFLSISVLFQHQLPLKFIDLSNGKKQTNTKWRRMVVRPLRTTSIVKILRKPLQISNGLYLSWMWSAFWPVKMFFVCLFIRNSGPQRIMLVLLGKSTRATNYLAQKTRKIQKLQMLQKYIDNLSWPFRKREYFIFGLIITKIFVTT